MTRTIPTSILIAMLFVGTALPEILPPQQAQFQDRLFPSETYSPDQLGNLEGRVFRRYSLQPLEDAAVVLGTDTSWTDIHGDYSFHDIPAGTYEVTSFAFGYNAHIDSVEIISDSTAHLDFYLPQPIIVVDVTGQPSGPPGSHLDFDFTISNLGDGGLTYDIEAIFEGTDPWLEAIPDSGVILPLASEQIILSIDVPDTAEAGQHYFAEVIIHNNTITPSITIPITLWVTENFVDRNDLTSLRFDLRQNYPNPFNPTTLIRFDIPLETEVEVSVFDMLGNKVATLIRQRMEAGSHTVSFDGSSLPSGMYFCRIYTPRFADSKKMILMK